jgi:uncharacterized protein
MKCPICDVNLLLSEKQGIEIDYCPKCRSIWLDRGELDKIIEKSQPASSREYHDRHDEHDRYAHHGYKKNRKKSFFEELFD